MINPASIMKIMNAKNKFTANHPKFAAFLNAVFSTGITEGTIIEITVTKPGEEPITTNMKVQQSDLELSYQKWKTVADYRNGEAYVRKKTFLSDQWKYSRI